MVYLWSNLYPNLRIKPNEKIVSYILYIAYIIQILSNMKYNKYLYSF